jgi:hypothetical protein
MPEELWFSIPLNGDGMEKLNVFAFYSHGALVRENRDVFQDDEDRWGQLKALFKLQDSFRLFIDRSTHTTWKSSRHRAQQVLDLIGEVVKGGITPSPPNAILIPEGYQARMTGLITAFEATFASDAMAANVFSVSRKGTHDPMALMELAEENLPPDTRTRLSPETIKDIRDAGQCLALDCHTASGYHILRAVERVIIKYVEKVTSKVTLKKKPRDWGAYITVLQNHGGDAKVIGNLQHIKDHYRNPIIHPEDTLGPDNAFSLFNTSISAIIQLDAAIEAWP